MKTALGIAILGFGLSTAASALTSPLCPPSGNAGVDHACNLAVRAKELQIRNWLTDAYAKAQLAHIADYTNASYPVLMAQLAGNVGSAVSATPMAQIDTRFADLNVVNEQNRLSKVFLFNHLQALANVFPSFSTVTQALSISDWATRVPAGQGAFSNLPGSAQLDLLNFLEFTARDALAAASYLEASGTSLGACAFTYPFQFTVAGASMYPLIAFAGASSNSGCTQEAYRAILVQAFTANGGVLEDSNFNAISYLPTPGISENLTAPAPILAQELTDPKIGRAFTDSVVAIQTAEQASDIDSTRLDQVANRLNALFTQLATPTSQRITFYQGMTTYAMSKASLIYRRLAARYSDELRILESRRR